MNLHAIAASAISAVNPMQLITVQVSAGPVENPDGSQTPGYAAPVTVLGQVQSLTFGDIQQLDGLNIQGVRKAIYLNGQLDGLVRVKNKGGDLITLSDGTVYLVALVLESWPDWVKVAATMQDGS